MDKYNQRGVSAQKSEVHEAVKALGYGLFKNTFCKISPDLLCNDSNYVNVMHADGAGTKSSLAYLYWKETGDLSVWHDLVQDAIVMNTDDMLCAGISNNFLLSNTIGRNKHILPGEVLNEIILGFEKFISKMKTFDINIQLTGGETADVGDIVKTIIIDSTIVAREKKEEIININIQKGDVIVGLSSFGQASYENKYNSGIGSNGLTSARHDLLHKSYRHKYPETYDSHTKSELIYSGNYQIEDSLESTPLNIGQAILSPTRTYLPLFQEIFRNHKSHIHGLIHCTGGGQTKVLKFLDPKLCVVKDKLFDIPPIFKAISQTGYPLKEMYEVFNMGHRMEIYLSSKHLDSILKSAEKFGIDAKIIGRVVPKTQESLRIYSDNTWLTY